MLNFKNPLYVLLMMLLILIIIIELKLIIYMNF